MSTLEWGSERIGLELRDPDGFVLIISATSVEQVKDWLWRQVLYYEPRMGRGEMLLIRQVLRYEWASDCRDVDVALH